MGPGKNENPNQGAFIIEELTELVEEAVLAEFERMPSAAACWARWKQGYQRGKIQERACTTRCSNTRRATPSSASTPSATPRRPGAGVPELARSTEEEKQSQLRGCRRLPRRHAARPRHAQAACSRP